MSRNHLLLLLALAFVLLLGACSSGGGTTTPAAGGGTLNPEELVPEVQVQVVDHQFRRAGESDEALNIDPIPGLIAAARTSLDVALPRLNRQEIVQQFLAAANRGVQVRIVTEKGYFDDPAYKPFYDQLEDVTKNAGNIQVHTDDDGFPRLMQSRFLVIDQSRVVTGSYTWESSDFDHTFGDVVSILNTNVAATFTNQFNQMFSEGNFGVRKRDETQHTFAVGNNQGLLEVYFGPTDRLRERIEGTLASSTNIHVAIQQFTDFTLANDFASWVASDPARRLFLFINNGGVLGDEEDNAVFNAFQTYANTPPDNSGELVLGSFGLNFGLEDLFGVELADYGRINTMNHKLVFFDNNPSPNSGLASDGTALPGVITTTANFTSLGLTENDEVMLILRGQPLANKYIRGPRIEPFAETGGIINLQRWGLDLLPGNVAGETVQLPSELRTGQDIQEYESLLAMFPHISSLTADNPNHRDLPPAPTGIIFGTIPNFKRTVQIPASDQGGDPTTAVIDISFECFGTLFTGEVFGLDNENSDGTRDPDVDPPPIPLSADFDANEKRNPNHRFILVVPAGDVTLRSIVTDTDGAQDTRFSTSQQHIVIGPGAVREVVLNVNLAPNRAQTGGTV